MVYVMTSKRCLKCDCLISGCVVGDYCAQHMDKLGGNSRNVKNRKQDSTSGPRVGDKVAHKLQGFDGRQRGATSRD